MDIEPHGFPMKVFEPGDEAHVDLNVVAPDAFAEAMGLGTSGAAEAIKSALVDKRGGLPGLDKLAEVVAETEEDKNVTKFQIARALRIVKLMQAKYGPKIGGRNQTLDLVSPWAGGIGKAALVSLEGEDEGVAKLIANSVLSTIYDFLSESRLRGVAVLLLFESPEQIVPARAGRLSEEFLELFAKYAATPAGIALQAKADYELVPAALEGMTARIECIEDEIVVKPAAERPFRARPRPPISSFASE